jgi:hypothetical protein
MSDLSVLVSEGFASRVDNAKIVNREVSQTAEMALTTEQLMIAMRLVDEIIDCDARLYANLDAPRRAQLESAIADRAETLKAFLDSAHGEERRFRCLSERCRGMTWRQQGQRKTHDERFVGMRMMVRVHQHAAAQNCGVRWRSIQPAPARVAAAAGLDHVLHFEK